MDLPRAQSTSSQQRWSSADAVAQAALRLSESMVEDSLDELAGVSLDHETLVDACERLRNIDSGDAHERAVQHMAFSLVSALFDRAARLRRTSWHDPLGSAR